MRASIVAAGDRLAPINNGEGMEELEPDGELSGPNIARLNTVACLAAGLSPRGPGQLGDVESHGWL